jgi:hypothetical protein
VPLAALWVIYRPFRNRVVAELADGRRAGESDVATPAIFHPVNIKGPVVIFGVKESIAALVRVAGFWHPLRRGAHGLQFRARLNESSEPRME